MGGISLKIPQQQFLLKVGSDLPHPLLLLT